MNQIQPLKTIITFNSGKNSITEKKNCSSKLYNKNKTTSGYFPIHPEVYIHHTHFIRHIILYLPNLSILGTQKL